MLEHIKYIKLKSIHKLTMFLRREVEDTVCQVEKECMGEGSLALLSRRYGAY